MNESTQATARDNHDAANALLDLGSDLPSFSEKGIQVASVYRYHVIQSHMYCYLLQILAYIIIVRQIFSMSNEQSFSLYKLKFDSSPINAHVVT